MTRYILKRLLYMIPVLLGVSFLIFGIMALTPGDPAMAILGDGATPEALEALREEMGFNRPFLIRYFDYLVGALHGDLGVSYMSKLPVFDEILLRLPYTARLAFFGIGFAMVIGIPIGIISAVKQYSILDTTVTSVSLILTSMPGFLIGLLLILVFSVRLGWLPMIGLDSFKAHIMPCIALASPTLAAMIRMTRSTMLEVIRQDYIRTARAKGATEKRVIFRHALRNSLMPVITVAGMNFGVNLGGSIVIEQLFAIPGIGQYMINGIRQKDTPVVMATVMTAALLASLVNLAVDIIYTYVDPRLKAQFSIRKKRKVSV